MDRFNVKYKATGFRGYPVGTVAYYGPDDRTVTKVVASIIKRYGDEVSVMQKWFSDDFAHDREVQKEIRLFLKKNKARSIVVTDSPIGCIHEEGIDYPTGQDCPHCPFWKGKQ